MERRTVIKLRDRPTLIKETAEWFASKWHLPVAVYEEVSKQAREKMHRFRNGMWCWMSGERLLQVQVLLTMIFMIE